MTTTVRTGDWMQTFSGMAFYPLDPRPDEIVDIDIAHGLSMLCRYNGHTSNFYSVAEHCVKISEWIEEVSTVTTALWGLLHDATEAYVGDMIRPLKRSMPAYVEVENNLMDAICYRYGLAPGMPEEVKYADNAILLDERAVLLGQPPMPWHQDEARFDPLGIKIECWSPDIASARYTDRLAELVAKVIK